MNKILIAAITCSAVLGCNLHAFNKAKQQAVKPVATTTPQLVKPAVLAQSPAVQPQVQVRQPQVNPQQAPHVTQADFQALINAVVLEEVNDLLSTTLQHPILGTNKDDFLAALHVYRQALDSIEKDPRVQALPTKTQLHAQVQNLPKRSLTQQEKDGIVLAVGKFKMPVIYSFYLHTHPDVNFEPDFYQVVTVEAQKNVSNQGK